MKWRYVKIQYQQNILTYSLTIGIILLLLSFAVFIHKDWVKDLLRTLGSIIVASGVFSAIVKSKFFTDIFRDQLRKVVYCDEHLSVRSDINTIWENVTKQLYQSRFPELTRDISEALLGYVPTDAKWYYDNFNYEIHISFLDDEKQYIILNEKEEFTIKAMGSQPIHFKTSSTFKHPKTDHERSGYELISLKINESEVDLDKPENKPTIRKRNGTISVKHNKELKGTTSYLIEREEEKCYSLIVENNKSIRANQLIKNFKLMVTFPRELNLKFYAMGTKKEFRESKNHNGDTTILQARYQGLILPRQGCRLIFTK